MCATTFSITLKSLSPPCLLPALQSRASSAQIVCPCAAYAAYGLMFKYSLSSWSCEMQAPPQHPQPQHLLPRHRPHPLGPHGHHPRLPHPRHPHLKSHTRARYNDPQDMPVPSNLNPNKTQRLPAIEPESAACRSEKLHATLLADRSYRESPGVRLV